MAIDSDNIVGGNAMASASQGYGYGGRGGNVYGTYILSNPISSFYLYLLVTFIYPESNVESNLLGVVNSFSISYVACLESG